MAMIEQRRVFGFGAETTSGTAATIAASTFCYSPIVQYDVPMQARPFFGTLSDLEAVPGARSAKATFEVELGGGGSSGSPEPAWAPLLKGCSMKVASHVYTMDSNPGDYVTYTISVYEQVDSSHTVVKTIVGAMGTVTLDAKSGESARLKFEFTGVDGGVVDAASGLSLPTPPALPPRFASASFGITPTGGSLIAPLISKFNLSFGNTVKLVESINTATGYAYGVVTARKLGGSIDPLAVSTTAWDVFGQLHTPITSAMSLQIGNTAGNTITVAAPAVQWADVKEANRDKLVTHDLKYSLTAVTGDDELSITFS